MTGFIEMELTWTLAWDEIQRMKPYGIPVQVPAQLVSVRREECSAFVLNKACQDKLLAESNRSHMAGYASLSAVMRLIGDIAGEDLLGYLTIVEITYDRVGFGMVSIIHPRRLTEAESYAKSS